MTTDKKKQTPPLAEDQNDPLKGKIIFGEVRPKLTNPVLKQVEWPEMTQDGWMVPPFDEGPLAERFRLIKRQCLKSFEAKAESANPIIQITSTLPKEGKSTVAYNLAMSVSLERDWSVFLIDACSNEERLTNLFGLSDRDGLIDYLLDDSLHWRDLVLCCQFENVYFLPSGRAHVRQSELFASLKMKAFFESLNSYTRKTVFIIDTPALLEDSESESIGECVDSIAYVVEMGSTPQNLVKQAIAKLPNEKISGTILNKTT